MRCPRLFVCFHRGDAIIQGSPSNGVYPLLERKSSQDPAEAIVLDTIEAGTVFIPLRLSIAIEGSKPYCSE